MFGERERFRQIAGNFLIAMKAVQSEATEHGWSFGDLERIKIASVVLIVDAIEQHWNGMPQ